MLGLRDYVEKNGFPGIILGLSGGVDSALVAALAVDALGAKARARGDDAVPLYLRCEPSRCSRLRQGAWRALRHGADRAGGRGHSRSPCASLLAGTKPDATEENIQARARGLILMAMSNKFGGMVVTTGNKSEMSVGYATLYGDMNGGFNPVKDLYKMEVYRLARWRNAHLPTGALGPAGVVIPERHSHQGPDG